jgi:hypothetical protein
MVDFQSFRVVLLPPPDEGLISDDVVQAAFSDFDQNLGGPAAGVRAGTDLSGVNLDGNFETPCQVLGGPRLGTAARAWFIVHPARRLRLHVGELSGEAGSLTELEQRLDDAYSRRNSW